MTQDLLLIEKFRILYISDPALYKGPKQEILTELDVLQH